MPSPATSRMPVVPRRPRSALAAAFVIVLAGLVSCDDDPSEPAAPAVLTVVTATTGGAFDINGYRLRIDGSEVGIALQANDRVHISLSPDRAIAVSLAGVAHNCEITSGADRTVTLVRGERVRVDFGIVCTAPAELADLRILYVNEPRSGGDDLFEIRADGTQRTRLTSNGTSRDPAVSRDGRSIAYARLNGIHVRDRADGSDIRLLEEFGAGRPSWSPDGARLAYAVGDGWGVAHVRIVDLADRSATDLPSPEGWAFHPAWSPDGSRIAFVGSGIHTTTLDGSEVLRVSTGGYGPVWSPASDRIAFESGTIWIAHAQGGDQVRLQVLDQLEGQWSPTDWSPDGEWLLVTRSTGDREPEYDLFLARLTDDTLFRITADGTSHSGVFVPEP